MLSLSTYDRPKLLLSLYFYWSLMFNGNTQVNFIYLGVQTSETNLWASEWTCNICMNDILGVGG